MTYTIDTIDVAEKTTLSDLLGELRCAREPRALRVDGKVVAIITAVGEANDTQAESNEANTVDAADITNEPSIRKIVAWLWEGHDPVTLGENGQIVALIAGATDFAWLRELPDDAARAEERSAERE